MLLEFCKELLVRVFSGIITGIFTILGVIFGGLITFAVLLLIEWYKNKNATKNWSISLLYEVRNNLSLSINLLVVLKENFWDLPLPVESVINIYDNNFSIFYSLLRSGYRLKNQRIISLYSNYIATENQISAIRKISINFLYSLDNINRKKKSTTISINKILEAEESQLKRIKELHDLLLKETNCKIVKGELIFES